MFHVKQRRGFGLLLLAGLLAVLIAGCAGSTGPRGWAGPVNSDDTLIVASGSSRLDGLDANGRRLWRFPGVWDIPEKKAEKLKGIYGPAVLSTDGKVVFIGDYNGYVYAFRPGDFVEGETEISPFAAVVKLDEPIIGGLTLDPATGLLFAGAGRRMVSMSAAQLTDRIDRKGDPLTVGLVYQAGDEIWGRPVLGGGKVLFSSLDGTLYAVDPITGELKWSFKADKGLVSTPTIVGDRVLVSGFGSTLYAVDLDDGSEQWSFSANHWIWAEPAVAQNTAYVGDFDGIVHAVDISTGAESWSLALDKGAIHASPAIAGSTLIVSTNDGWLLGIDLGSQEVVWQRDIGTALNADITVDGSSVYIAPKGCVTPEGGGNKVYYIQVNASNGDLTAASGVC
jgi:outer membrane protein assembly factor BamB